MFSGHTGYEVTMITEACALMGCSFEFRNPPDLSWGKLGDDGKWSGHVRNLVDHKTDMAIGTIGMFVQRNNVRGIKNIQAFITPYYSACFQSIQTRSTFYHR